MYPDDLRYTPEHEWVRVADEGTIVFGITHYAQDALGDIVYVSLPKPGTHITAGEACGEVESTKSVSDIYAPVSGEVLRVNSDLDGGPEAANTDPYGAGWMVEVRPGDAGAVEQLLSAAAYRDLIEKS